MGRLIRRGSGWRSLFYFAAAVAGAILLANLLFLKESRAALGFPEPEVNPLNVFKEDGSKANSGNLSSLLKPLLLNREFWIVCFLSLCTTIVRETFNTWTPTYLHNLFAYSAASAAGASAVFPAVGAISVVIAGWTSDQMGARGRSIVLVIGLVLTTVGLSFMTAIKSGAGSLLPMVLIGIVAFGLLGPYSYLAGAMALDFGGQKGGATSSGIIDGVGYLGGVLAGDSVARVSIGFGWRGVFFALAIVSAASAIAAGILSLRLRRKISEVLD